MKISIIGTGYVGLVTGTCFAEMGVDVVCVDVDKEKINGLKAGIIPIYEPGLESLVIRNIEAKRLQFTTSLVESLASVHVILIAVGTPPDQDGSADLKYVLQVAQEIGQNINDYVLVVTKSTVPIGTAEKIRKTIITEIEKRGVDIKFDVASNPEFLKEGDAVNDCLKPDRIVVGTDSENAKNILKNLYKPFLLNGHPIIFMDIPSAELTKYAANAMLATKISFINDIANLCDRVGADVNLVRKGIGSDSRIGDKFIYAGVGYGGSCFPKDVKAIIKTAKESGYRLRVLQAVEDVNDDQKSVLYFKVKNYFKGNLKGKKFGIWGLSFKPKTDDMREAPALVLIDKFIEDGASVIAYDPVAMDETRRRIKDKIRYASNAYEALDNVDAWILVTEWNEFRNPDWNKISSLVKNKIVFDGRNIYDPEEVRMNGFEYFGIGRK